jgi:hypothetical protein
LNTQGSKTCGGADLVCLGMFDFQVKQDVELTQKAFEKSRNRKRPWIGKA